MPDGNISGELSPGDEFFSRHLTRRGYADNGAILEGRFVIMTSGVRPRRLRHYLDSWPTHLVGKPTEMKSVMHFTGVPLRDIISDNGGAEELQL